MMEPRRILTVVLWVLVVASCGPSPEEKGSYKLNLARKLLVHQDTLQALKQLDSIPMLYPKAAYSINAAKNLKKEVYWDMLQLKEREIDSVKARISSLEGSFITEKAEFDRLSRYFHRNQVPGLKMSRSCLIAEVDERGGITLVSQYVGNALLYHTRVKVFTGDLEATSDSVPVGDVDNYQSSFLGSRWERITFRNGRDKGVIELIARHAEEPLKVLFGGQRNYLILLEKSDREAIREAFEFSTALRKKQLLELEIRKLQVKI